MARYLPLFLMLAACGGSVASSQDAGSNPKPPNPSDASVSADAIANVDAGVDADIPYPAPHPDVPQVVARGGPQMKKMKVIPVFYSGDTLQAKIESMLQQLPQSAYWSAITSDYGGTQMTIGSSIVLQDTPPSSIDDSQIKTWLATQGDGNHAPWPAVDAEQIYLVFYPSQTKIYLDGTQSCNGFGGYHYEASNGNITFPYSVIPRCGGGSTLTALDSVTSAVSHELIEAATDPFPESDPGYQLTDEDHYLWSYFPGGEVGDMCAFERQSYQPLVGGFTVQRSWSNTSAKAGHDPCVPALQQPYFNSAPDFQDKIQLSFGPDQINTKGMKIPIGQSKTVDVVLFSDAPTGPWTVDAIDYAALRGQSPTLSFSFDKNSGKNGDVLHLTVSAIKQGQYGLSMFVIRSTQNGVEHLWYGSVVNK